MKISASEMGFIDLTENIEMDNFFNAIQFNEEKEIVLDLSSCLVGYETGSLIEKVLQKLSESTMSHRLIIEIDYDFLSEDTLFDWLFRNSTVWSKCNVSEDNAGLKNKIIYFIKEKYDIDFEIRSTS
jgi:hypothetical protein